MSRFKAQPHGTDRLYWHQFYVTLFNKDQSNHQAEHMAVWYLLLHLAFDEKMI